MGIELERCGNYRQLQMAGSVQVVLQSVQVVLQSVQVVLQSVQVVLQSASIWD